MKKIGLIFCFLFLLAISANAQKVIAEKAAAVPAGGYWYMNLPIEKAGTVVSGRFKAQGGSGNDIIMYILDVDGFENFKNGHSVNTYYNSGKLTVANFRVSLDKGFYYLVLDNRFSAFSSKAVELKFFDK